METSHVSSNPKLRNFSSDRDLNPPPSDYMSNALPSELSGHVDIITFSAGGRDASINTYYFSDAWMAFNRAKVIGIDAGWRPPAEIVMMSSTHWEVQIIIELMINYDNPATS